MFVGGVQAALGLVLAGRMAYIAVAENEKYKLLSESNRVNLTLIPPRRGWFIDRFGKPIATNRADFRVDIIPDRVVNKKQTVETLTKLLSLSDDDVERITTDRGKGSGPATLKTPRSWLSSASPMAKTASCSCINWKSGSKPKTVGTRGPRR